MAAWRTRLVALLSLLALAWGCDGSIGSKDLTPGGRADDEPPSIPDAPPTGGGGDVRDGGDGGDGSIGGRGGVGGGGAVGGGGGGTGGDPDPGGPCANGPLAGPIPGCAPTPVPDTGDEYADCVARINQLRWECQCLPPLERWNDGEACTDGNAEYDSVNGPHASFFDQPCGSGARAQNECPGWPSNDAVISSCLQAMWDEGPEDGNPNTENGHYETMASGTYTRVACGFYTTPSGDVWGVQNFD